MTKPPGPGLFGRLRGGRIAGILGVCSAFAFGVLQVVDLLADNPGSRSRVFPTALVLLVVGLPFILATALPWIDSDPILQPRVEQIRRRLSRLTAERG